MCLNTFDQEHVEDHRKEDRAKYQEILAGCQMRGLVAAEVAQAKASLVL